MADDDVTIGELFRSIEGLKSELRDRLKGVQETSVTRREYEENRTRVGERLGAVERTLTAIGSRAWTAIGIGIAIPIFLALIENALHLKP